MPFGVQIPACSLNPIHVSVPSPFGVMDAVTVIEFEVLVSDRVRPGAPTPCAVTARDCPSLEPAAIGGRSNVVSGVAVSVVAEFDPTS